MITIGIHPSSVTPVTNVSVTFTTMSDIINPTIPSDNSRIGRVMSLSTQPMTRFTRPSINIKTSNEETPVSRVTHSRYCSFISR